MKKYILVLFLGITICPLLAQQIPSLNQYYLNPYLLNPAFAGNKEQAEAFVHYRKQWVGLPGAPETQMITIDGPLSQEKVGLGAMFYNNAHYIMGRTGGMLTGSYEARLNQRQTLGFGLSIGFMQNRIFFDRIRANDPFEQSILNNLEQKTLLDANVGIRFQHDNLTVGLASHQLMENKSRFENNQDDKSLTYALVRHYTATLGYKFDLKADMFSMEPLLMVRSAEGIGPQFDFNTVFRYRDVAWLALTYKHEAGAAVAAGVIVEDRIGLGYTYEFSTTELRNAHDNSHEISLSYRFGQFQGGGSGKVDTKGISRDWDLENLKKKNALLFEKMAEDGGEVVDVDYVNSGSDTVFVNLTPVARKRKYKLGEVSEAKNGYYVVIGAYYTLKEAKSFQRLVYKHMPKTLIIAAPAAGSDNLFYFVCTDYLYTKKAATRALFRVNRDKIKIEDYINGYPWIYIVNNE